MTIKIETTAAAVFTANRDWASSENLTKVTAWIGNDFLGESNTISPVPENLEANDTYTIAKGLSFPFTITPANGAAGDADATFIALLGTGSVTLRLHHGDPGNSHTANEYDSTGQPGYARQTVAFKTVAN